MALRVLAINHESTSYGVVQAVHKLM